MPIFFKLEHFFDNAAITQHFWFFPIKKQISALPGQASYIQILSKSTFIKIAYGKKEK